MLPWILLYNLSIGKLFCCFEFLASFIEIQRQGIILGPMCLCLSKTWKSKAKIFFHTISRVGLKFPWLRNHVRLINNKSTSPIRCFDQGFLYSIVFYVIYEQELRQITQYRDLLPTTQNWPISTVNHGFASQIHHATFYFHYNIWGCMC